MTRNPINLPIVDPKRFKTIQDLTRLRPDCGASIDDIFVIDNQLLLIIDLSNIGDILNPYNSPSASYVRTHGVIAHSHVCSKSRPIFWGEPLLLLPWSCHLGENLTAYEDIGKVVARVFCPSGTFLMVPIRQDMPTPLGSLADAVLAQKTGAHIKIPNGTYRVFYEQFEAPKGSKKEDYQNIVAQRQ